MGWLHLRTECGGALFLASHRRRLEPVALQCIQRLVENSEAGQAGDGEVDGCVHRENVGLHLTAVVEFIAAGRVVARDVCTARLRKHSSAWEPTISARAAACSESLRQLGGWRCAMEARN